ncbi:MAG: sporulation protein YtfJ [Ruminococcaceae bacterium]|nr:sporulation protein YtfJ [Oscillospiraceae bacterium]
MNENNKNNGREKLSDIVASALENIKEITDVNTVVGDPINAPGGVSIVPITSVSVGFASGGIDGLGKRTRDKANSMNFAGGGGTGIKISPIGFLVIKADGTVDFLSASENQKTDKFDTVIELIERSPEFIKRIRTAFAKEEPSENKVEK